MLRRTLMAASRSTGVRKAVETVPASRRVVARFIAGTRTEDALHAARHLMAEGLAVSLDRLGENTRDRAGAEAARTACTDLLRALARTGLAARTEISVKLSALGQLLPREGQRTALDNARAVCEAARAAGTTVTLDMEDHTTTDSTLAVARALREDFPDLGVVLQSALLRTEGDCRDLAGPGSRVRLCKGAYDEPASVAHRTRREIDLAYVRCLGILMAGRGYPMVATHDPRLVRIAKALALGHGRAPGTYEHQMLYGIRPEEQLRLAAAGETVRIYVPYGDDWYGYFMRRLAERPANLVFFLRALATRG
ncbi:proline dehydrogenase family protein [Streptomyces sp. HB2AG]|uniref:proline dehydrogenase family protein n=1 Tax=Streptomyces sp. HB2AG TaxID=2983400 RepID=UPI0022AA817C|nr:proline dehydrogenase family protein [Streptomyces sp. HB2AG]MCZ2526813.1 proline dehydrogenase family protein [Streptomyces sp. HB2AG]